MSLKVRFVNKVNTVFIAKLIPQGIIGVVTGADRVQIILLHEPDIPEHILLCDASSAFCIPFVTVYSSENNTLSVYTHNAVFKLEPAEAGLCLCGFYLFAVFICKNCCNCIEVGPFRAPRLCVRYLCDEFTACSLVHCVSFIISQSYV